MSWEKALEYPRVHAGYPGTALKTTLLMLIQATIFIHLRNLGRQSWQMKRVDSKISQMEVKYMAASYILLIMTEDF